MSTIVPRSGLLSDKGGSGPMRRIRVDDASTGFFAGRMFSSTLEFSLSDSDILVTKLVTPIDLILYELSIELTAGEVRSEIVVAGTEGGTFVDTDVLINQRNNMSFVESYTRQAALYSGGTLTGGLTIDLFLNKVSGNANKASLGTASSKNPIGVAAGTSYLRNTATGATSGIIRSLWEEVPAGTL